MWTLTKHFKSSPDLSEIEKLTLERAAELEILSQRLLQVQDQERRKIARDLHDSTGQTLTALKISISFLQESCKDNAGSLAIVDEVEKLADQAISEIRTMAYLLHPPLLDEVGFVCAAEWYIEGFAKRSGIAVKANIASSGERLPSKMEIALFRVLQETLTNIHRHSGASEASVNFHCGRDFVVLEVRDFGKGITQERLRLLSGMSAETGIGLAGMRERLHELKGKLEIESDGKGTRLRATVPLGAAPAPFLVHNEASVGICPPVSQ
jgi:two-component system, NarL family, sensor kinase